MPSKKYVGTPVCPLLEDQKQAEFSLKEKSMKTAEGTLGQELITSLVLENNETTKLQNPHISHNEERPALHASRLGLAESIGGSLSTGHSQSSASHSSWIDTQRGVSGEGSSSHATFAGLAPYRFQYQTIHSAPTSMILGVTNCQVATQEQVSGDTETVYTGSVEHQGCSTLGGMQNLGLRSHNDSQSAHYNQLLDQSSWINSTLEASRQNLSGLSIKQSVGAKTPSDEPLDLTNYLDGMNEEAVTTKIVPMGNRISGIQPTTQLSRSR